NKMQDLFLYILQVNVLITFIYLGYYFFLRKLTFYKWNRFYFIIGVLYALLYPFIDFGPVQVVSQSMPLQLPMDFFFNTAETTTASSVPNLLDILLLIMPSGSVIL